MEGRAEGRSICLLLPAVAASSVTFPRSFSPGSSHQSLCLHCNGRLSVCGEWRLKFYNFNLPVPAPDSLSLFIKHTHTLNSSHARELRFVLLPLILLHVVFAVDVHCQLCHIVVFYLFIKLQNAVTHLYWLSEDGCTLIDTSCDQLRASMPALKPTTAIERSLFPPLSPKPLKHQQPAD